MNNENDHRRLLDSTPSPILRRSKSVRASFRMLGSRWKSSSSSSSSSNNGGGGGSKIDSTTGPVQKHAITSKDAVSERFGKDFNRNVKQPMTDPSDRLQSMIPPTTTTTTSSSSSSLPQSILPIKTKTKFFHAFAKENVNERHIQYEIPKNVAPKAAALLQIPVLPHRHPQQQHQQPMNGNIEPNIQYSHQHHRYQHQELRKKHDLIKMDGKFNMHLDRNSCDLIANSNQFALLKSLSENSDAPNSQDIHKAATIRRTPYWPNSQPLKYSKNFGLFLLFLHSHFCASRIPSVFRRPSMGWTRLHQLVRKFRIMASRFCNVDTCFHWFYGSPFVLYFCDAIRFHFRCNIISLSHTLTRSLFITLLFNQQQFDFKLQSKIPQIPEIVFHFHVQNSTFFFIFFSSP